LIRIKSERAVISIVGLANSKGAYMRRFLLTTICLCALTGGAFAADLPRGAPPAKEPVFLAGYNWTGFYAGINGGYGWADSNWSAFGTGSNPSGGLVGGTLGFNWQGVGSPYVFGVEGDIDWSDIKGRFVNGACPSGCETKNTWLGTLRGRLGYAADRVMPYFTGGLAIGDVQATRASFGSVSDTQVGWTIGAGVETAVAANWTAKIEYLYVDLGSMSCNAPACLPGTNVSFHTNIVRAGVNLRF